MDNEQGPSDAIMPADGPKLATDGTGFRGDAAPVQAAKIDRHPAAIWFFFWGEFAERSSYYGMRAILFLYLTTALHFSDTEAGPLYSAFKMGCYLLPLLGP